MCLDIPSRWRTRTHENSPDRSKEAQQPIFGLYYANPDDHQLSLTYLDAPRPKSNANLAHKPFRISEDAHHGYLRHR